ncbi:elongin-A [Pholidichthys leucotaenia]
MAEDLLETVERLQSRLQENQESRKLLKTLKRLGELPMTVDILVETGVGKTVNSLRKHEEVGEVAKSLVAKWKKLVPQSTDRPNSHSKDASRHKRPREPSPEEEERSYIQEEEEEEEEEERGYHRNYSPSPPQYTSPHQGGYQSEEYESAEPEPSPPPPPPPPPQKEVRHPKPNKEPSKNHHHHGDRRRDRDEERRQRHTEETRGGGVNKKDGKKRSGDRESQPSPVQKSVKHNSRREEKKRGGDEGRSRSAKDSPFKEEEEAFETPTMSFESFLTYDAPTPVKKKKKPLAPPSSSSHSRMPQPSSSSSTPSSSHRTPPSSSSSSSTSSSKVNKASSSQSTKRSHSSSTSSAAAPTSEKRKKVVEAVPTLPEIPLPAIQPNYRPLPSIDVTPLTPPRRKVPVFSDEDDTGFTGKRFNSKMVVYSGSKTAYLPKMMTLFEQCIRVLQNNIDSIAEVGGVPFEILEPVLERCTPEQLYRIEQSNQWFTEDSDELWMRHCQRDFKRESPQEYESWRELYLRLHEEREERLRLLTHNISSAHANKPKGRQVKMAFVNSVAKPPRDVRRRQEKFGTTSGTSTAASTAAAAPIKIRPAASDFSGESSRPSSSQQNPSPGSSRSSAPSGGGGGGGGGGHVAREKPQVKKIAPMMAKTIKAFKNRFSRR